MKTDLIVVGGGILGLATAFQAHEQGLTVRVIDRAERPVGSSIMNFGHACFTGQADSVMDTMWKSRAGWIHAAEKTGIWFRNSGTFVPAVSETEMKVLEEFAAHRGSEQVELLSGLQVAKGVGNPELKCFGGAFLPLDSRVNPREAAPQLAYWLQQQGVIFNWRHELTNVGNGNAETNRGNFEAERVVVCPNFWLTQLFPELADHFNVRLCTLTMSLIDRPSRIPQDIALFTGSSLTRYDGFSAMPSVSALKDELAEREPKLVDCTANLMATGIDGGLFVGDSHSYDLSPEPFIDQSVADSLLDGVASYFNIENPKVLQRWQGRYADSPTTNLVLERPDEQTTVAAVTSGIGMTSAFGVAELILDGKSSEGWGS
jgi:FAD dependent oxidoreductase TIGR03364